MLKRLFIWWQWITPHHLLSRLVGAVARCRWVWFKNLLIKAFIKAFDINVSEAKTTKLSHYQHFNAFFTRELKDKARPIAQDEQAIISPVDGAISEIGRIVNDKILQAKGQKYRLGDLLANFTTAKDYEDGMFATIYLSPKDYHRVHMPLTGTLQRMTFVPGRIFSVNPTTVKHVKGLFARNERVVAEFITDKGPMSVIFVGAMLVASIQTAWAGIVAPSSQKKIQVSDYRKLQLTYQKGDEIGQFLFGSTVILLFGPNQMAWQDHLKPGQSLVMGQQINITNATKVDN